MQQLTLQEADMRNLMLMVLPIFAAASLSGLMFSATLA